MRWAMISVAGLVGVGCTPPHGDPSNAPCTSGHPGDELLDLHAGSVPSVDDVLPVFDPLSSSFDPTSELPEQLQVPWPPAPVTVDDPFDVDGMRPVERTRRPVDGRSWEPYGHELHAGPVRVARVDPETEQGVRFAEHVRWDPASGIESKAVWREDLRDGERVVWLVEQVHRQVDGSGRVVRLHRTDFPNPELAGQGEVPVVREQLVVRDAHGHPRYREESGERGLGTVEREWRIVGAVDADGLVGARWTDSLAVDRGSTVGFVAHGGRTEVRPEALTARCEVDFDGLRRTDVLAWRWHPHGEFTGEYTRWDEPWFHLDYVNQGTEPAGEYPLVFETELDRFGSVVHLLRRDRRATWNPRQTLYEAIHDDQGRPVWRYEAGWTLRWLAP